MRLKVIFSLAFILTACLWSTSLYAQEDPQAGIDVQELNSHPELNLNDDKTLIVDTDSKAVKPGQTNNQTAQSKDKKQEIQSKSSGSGVDKNGEDPLSFNFLYFIIQKFKISDIIDD